MHLQLTIKTIRSVQSWREFLVQYLWIVYTYFFVQGSDPDGLRFGYTGFAALTATDTAALVDDRFALFPNKRTRYWATRLTGAAIRTLVG